MGYDKKDAEYIKTVLEEEKYHQTSEEQLVNSWAFAPGSFRCGKLAINNLALEVGAPHGKTAVELGAGGGAMSWLLAEAGFDTNLCELDPNSLFSGLVYEHKNLGVGHRIVCDATIPPLKKESVDVIFCKEFIHHVKNKYKFVQLVNNKLKSDGIFVLIEPIVGLYQWFYNKRHPDPHTDHFMVSMRAYLKCLKHSGFTIAKTGLYFYKETGSNKFTGYLKKLFNNEMQKGMKRNGILKQLYGLFINGTVVILARKQKTINIDEQEYDIQVISPQILTLHREYLNQVKKFSNLLKDINTT